MELKKYQQDVIADLERFLSRLQEVKHLGDSFYGFWSQHPKTPLQPFVGSAIEPYKNNIPGVPHVCVKVPTAGGKTFIACNAIKTIFDSFSYDKNKVVVWLVPSITILDQTLRNLSDSSHPYRQKLNTHFNGRVEIFDKSALLQGSSFNPSSVQEQLNIIVMSFDSFRSRSKEDRKVYQENGNLQSFGSLLGTEEEISLMKVIQALNPVVVVDESHNAESELSVDMLVNLNPCFILDLTATPRKNSNIISFVDALELKRENMVKLPVIVYNHHDKTEVIHSALQLQRKLEKEALEEHKNGGRYIRPIVLFQAQPRNAEDNTTFEKLKEKLVELQIPAEQIRIKTANINEIKSEDLMSPDCPVRYIITVNVLKEGWDCPFAYILASLADKSSAVDVEQILGRVLRQPYVTKHSFALLNLSYVLTASDKFIDTLDNIVKGLNKAGFSKQDYKLPETNATTTTPAPNQVLNQLTVFATDGEEQEEDISSGIDSARIMAMIETEAPAEPLSIIETMAIQETSAMDARVMESAHTQTISLPSEIQSIVKKYSMKEFFRPDALSMQIPQFFLQVPAGEIFGGDKLLEKEELLDRDFKLSQEDTKIDFTNVTANLYKVDLDESKKEHTPSFIKLDGAIRDSLQAYLLDPARIDSRVKNFTKRIMTIIGKFDPIPDSEIMKYISRILEGFGDEQFISLVSHEYSYADKIKAKINSLKELFAEKKFREFLDTDKVLIRPSYRFPPEIIPGDISKDFPKSLYETEGRMNGFEERVINEIANMENIAFWTRNIERKGFCINGYINHYPDFIIRSKSGKTIILETKGDHLDAEAKIRLGNAWAAKAGNAYRYFMVYENRAVQGAYTLDAFLPIARAI
ncbi:MAG: DEAD/DEAH box helicase family protein [Bacteroidetes bacterium]|nr:DEAD/DEAH box helicase family protein [Bacteroidota bacterium]